MDNEIWHYVRNNEQAGPVNLETLRNLVHNGSVNGDTLVWQEGMSSWLALQSVDELKGLLTPAHGGLRLQARAEASGPPPIGAAPTPVPTGIAPTAPDVGAPDVATLLQESGGAAAHGGDFREGWFWGYSFEYNFFIVMLCLTAVGTGVTYKVSPEWIATSVLLPALLTVMVAGIVFRVRTFQAGILWGALGLVIGITDLVFIFVHWSRSWRPILLSLIGMVAIIASIASMAQTGEGDRWAAFFAEVAQDLEP